MRFQRRGSTAAFGGVKTAAAIETRIKIFSSLSDFFCRRLLFGPKPPRFVVRNIVSLFLGEEQLAVLTAKGVERRKSHWAWDLSDKLHGYVALRTVGHLHCHFFYLCDCNKARPGISDEQGELPEQPS